MHARLILSVCAAALACKARPTPAGTTVVAEPQYSSRVVGTVDTTEPGSAAAAPERPSAPEPDRPGPGSPSAKLETRCGWIDNPTPANWWITDRDGEWEIGVQGGYQAQGELPDFGSAWVETNGHYGYGCACIEARVDRSTKRVIAYRHVQTLPIDRCRKDKRLPPR